MSRRSVLVPGRHPYACRLCGENVVHDVVRVDGPHIYHMSCFNRHIAGGRRELRDCPDCRTLGALWRHDLLQWHECKVCGGTGYLRDTIRREAGPRAS